MKQKRIKYHDSVVGKQKFFAGKKIFVWYQDPFRVFSSENKKSYGMSVGLYEKLQDQNFDFVEIDEATIHISEFEDYETVLRYSDIFDDNPQEDQILVTIEG